MLTRTQKRTKQQIMITFRKKKKEAKEDREKSLCTMTMLTSKLLTNGFKYNRLLDIMQVA